ncbi:MAG: uroporphyrinogen decarboxylase family protein [Anaerolineae bacterium]
MEPSPDFERVRTALLSAGEPDRVPLAEAGIDKGIREAVLGRPIRTLADEVEFWRVAGYDFVPVHVGLRLMLSLGHDPTYDAHERTAALAAARLTGRALYGIGDSEERERAWAQEHKGVVTTWEEFDRFPWPTADEFDQRQTVAAVGALLPASMKAIMYQGHIFTLVWELMGFESFCFALTENPDLVDAIFEKVGTEQMKVFERLIGLPEVGAAWMPDDLAYTEALMVAPRHLRRWVFPWFKRMGAICRELGKPFIFHSDGRLYEVMDDIIDCGFTALHPIEPKAMGIRELKRRYAGRLCLMGNLDLGYTLTRGTPAEVVEETLGLIRDVGPGGGYCVGSSNSVPEYVPLANYNAMRETVLKYGAYPIVV